MPYVKDAGGIGRMLVMPGMIAAMRARAERVKAIAEATAPVDDGYTTRSGRHVPPQHPGRYKASFTVSSGVRPASEDPPGSSSRHARAFGRVTNHAPEARRVEFGTEHQSAHATLRRALEAGTKE